MPGSHLVAAVSDDSATPADTPLHLGPFMVRAAAADAGAFARATGGATGHIPFTFPVRWFARPEVRAAAAQMMGEAAWVPLHESQSFDYRMPLKSDVDYRMTIDMSREMKPARIVLRAKVVTDADEPCLTMEMILRIVSMPDAAGSLE
jgi:hypothetical protein